MESGLGRKRVSTVRAADSLSKLQANIFNSIFLATECSLLFLVSLDLPRTSFARWFPDYCLGVDSPTLPLLAEVELPGFYSDVMLMN